MKALRVKIDVHTPYGAASDSLCIFGEASDALDTIKYLVDGMLEQQRDKALPFVATVVRIDPQAALEYETLCLKCKTRVRPYAYVRHMRVRHNERIKTNDVSDSDDAA